MNKNDTKALLVGLLGFLIIFSSGTPAKAQGTLLLSIEKRRFLNQRSHVLTRGHVVYESRGATNRFHGNR